MKHNNLEKDLIGKMQKRLATQAHKNVEKLIEDAERGCTEDLIGNVSKCIENPCQYSDLWYHEKLMFEYGKLCYKKMWLEDSFRNGVVDWKKLYHLYEEIN